MPNLDYIQNEKEYREERLKELAEVKREIILKAIKN